MEFKELLLRAKNGEKQAREDLLEMYRPLIFKSSLVEGVFDEDLFQILCYKFICSIDKFEDIKDCM